MSELLFSSIVWSGDAMAFAKAHVVAGVLRIDDTGRIWRCAEKRSAVWVMVPERRAENPGGKGYLRVSLCIPGTGGHLATVMAHCLVYEVLVAPIAEGLQIDHKDNDKANNRPSNLEPVTGLENIRRSHERGRTKPWALAVRGERAWRDGRKTLSQEQIAHARKLRVDGAPLKRIAAELGIGISHAHRITSGGAS